MLLNKYEKRPVPQTRGAGLEGTGGTDRLPIVVVVVDERCVQLGADLLGLRPGVLDAVGGSNLNVPTD